MQYFLILLLLTACTAPKAETKQKAVAEAPSPEAETNQPPALAAEPKILPYPSKAWEEISNLVEFVDDGTYHDDPSYEEENPEFVFVPEYGAIKKSTTHKYAKEYAKFYESQLKLYGRHSNGDRIIKDKDNYSLLLKYPYLDDPSYEYKTPEFIYENDDTIYIIATNPYKDKYTEFYSNQLVKYGKDPEGRRIVNYKELMSFLSNYPPF